MDQQEKGGAQGGFALITPDLEQAHSVDVMKHRTEIANVLLEMLKIPDQTFPGGRKNLHDVAYTRLVLPIWHKLPIATGLKGFENQDKKVVEGEQFEGIAALAKSRDMKFSRFVAIGLKIMEDVDGLEIDGGLIVGQDSLSFPQGAKGIKVKNSAIYGANNFIGEVSDSILVVKSDEFWKRSRGKIGRNVWALTSEGLEPVPEGEISAYYASLQGKRVA